MNKDIKYAIYSLIIVASALFIFNTDQNFYNYNKDKDLAMSGVRMCILPDCELLGWGSGVYIGDGYFLTASHVADDHPILYMYNNKSKQSTIVNRLWYNPNIIETMTGDDIAVYKAENTDLRIKSVDLNCRVPKQGEPITIIGTIPASPNDQNREANSFLTWKGYIASDVRVTWVWDTAMLATPSIPAGVSGGPVLDEAENLIALYVGYDRNFSTIEPIYTSCEKIKEIIKNDKEETKLP